MGSESSSVNGGGGFRSRMEYYLYSGDKKHVFVGMAIIGVIFGIPWALMNRDSFALRDFSWSVWMIHLRSRDLGTKHHSHQDYMEKADKARSERLKSSASSSVK